ncbi:sialin isoform X2 [Brachionus plicatilis]|uniref:Sialin isoform X2 n=1 Tax=Brachionus plicatilis TaxID=10195 RepID=A0A3M7QC04_BRAPC|nr:sialin isoform X2 [Brachionus plicatilis]
MDNFNHALTLEWIRITTPWKPLFTAKPSLAIYVVTFCFHWGGYLYMTQIPTYIRDVLKFDIESNGILSSIPFFVSWIIVINSSFVADYLISRNKMPKIYVRKLYTALSMFTPMIALIFLSYVDCSSPYLAVFFLILGQALNGCSGTGGFYINSHEIAGPFSGILIGIQNMIGTIPGFVGPYVVGLLTSNQKLEEWRIAEVQSWAKVDINLNRNIDELDELNKQIINK